MTEKFKKLKDDLKSLENEDSSSSPGIERKYRLTALEHTFSTPNWLKKLLFFAFLGSFLLYAGSNYLGTSSAEIDGATTEVQNLVEGSEQDQLQLMEDELEDLGYSDLTTEELSELRNEGVTVTFISRMHDLGYADASLNQFIELRQNDVSSTFASMMNELGYDLSVDELIELRQNGVSVYFASNIHDLGYTDITTDDLIRLQEEGITISEAKQLIEQQEGDRPTVEELIELHNSSQ